MKCFTESEMVQFAMIIATVVSIVLTDTYSSAGISVFVVTVAAKARTSASLGA